MQQIFCNIFNDFLVYFGYPIYIAALVVFSIHFCINMCSPLIIKLVGEAQTEKQLIKIQIKNLEEENE